MYVCIYLKCFQVFVPRQRLVLARVTRDKIILYLYNLTRDTQDRLVSVNQCPLTNHRPSM